jgi:hypothetical protein
MEVHVYRGYPFLKALMAMEQQWNISKFSYGNPLISEPMGFSTNHRGWRSRATHGDEEFRMTGDDVL